MLLNSCIGRRQRHNVVLSCGHSTVMFVLKICDTRSIQSEIGNRKLLLIFSRLIQKEQENLVSELFNPIPKGCKNFR